MYEYQSRTYVVLAVLVDYTHMYIYAYNHTYTPKHIRMRCNAMIRSKTE